LVSPAPIHLLAVLVAAIVVGTLEVVVLLVVVVLVIAHVVRIILFFVAIEIFRKKLRCLPAHSRSTRLTGLLEFLRSIANYWRHFVEKPLDEFLSTLIEELLEVLADRGHILIVSYRLGKHIFDDLRLRFNYRRERVKLCVLLQLGKHDRQLIADHVPCPILEALVLLNQAAELHLRPTRAGRPPSTRIRARRTRRTLHGLRCRRRHLRIVVVIVMGVRVVGPGIVPLKVLGRPT